ncbi:MAG: type II toxin-antitoxin system RelE/ParE family toxin [Bacteroidetes bacterium]|nr:type II toxin-antitoxin system RelE/ParE family toxin [Bacteroidota bacterium]MCB0844975.1 type II toxin-antitoxin system RelE/ParE family toxin [Bacteroidota bacterium]
MSYVIDIHPDVQDDVMEIFLDIDENSPLQADRFVECVLEEYDQLLTELNNRVFFQEKKPVKYRSAGKFKRHLIFYEVNNKLKRVKILAISYSGRDPEAIARMINSRLDN